MYSLTTIPVRGYEIRSSIACAEADCDFGKDEFDNADQRLNDLREKYPRIAFELVAIVDA